MSEYYAYQPRMVDENNIELQKWMLLIDLQGRLESSGNGQLFQRIGIVTPEMQHAVANARWAYFLYGECGEVRE